MVNWGWRDIYDHAVGLAIPIVNSDHSPIVLLPNPPTRCARFFRYEAYWEDHKKCRGVVNKSWNCSEPILLVNQTTVRAHC